MIDTNTASAAMFAIRSPCGASEPSTNRANVMVATPLGPNQAMNALPAVSTSRAPASAANTAAGRATSSVKATIATAAQPSSNSPPKVRIAPNTRKTPSFTISIRSSERASKHSRTSGRQIPKAIAATNTEMKPLPSGGSVATP